MDPETLIADYYACDNSALQTLVEGHQGALVGFFVNGGQIPDEAETCAQEVWLRVIETKPPGRRSDSQFDPAQGTPFGAWLFGIARNVLRDARRRQRRAPAPLPAGKEEEVEPEIADPSEPPDEELAAVEVSEA